MPFRSLNPFITLLFLVVASTSVRANGPNRNGVGAVSMGMGGVAAANKNDPFAAASVNPALLSRLAARDINFSIVGGVGDGKFSGSRTGTGYLSDASGLFPELVIRRPLGDSMGLQFSLIPEQTRSAEWRLLDAPGGIDGNTSYGVQSYGSELIGLRGAAGLGFPITNTLSAGASVGVLYNSNHLQSPYTFQSHPVLAGFKTALDLETDGFGINGDFGILWEPTECLSIGLAYRTPTRVVSRGTANGDIGAQFRNLGINAPSQFSYDATVTNHFPDQISLGGTLDICDRTTLHFELNYIRWADAFDNLSVQLRSGNNATINQVLGTTSIDDVIPLKWNDVLVSRVGVEHRINDSISLRAGYSYGKSPVPDETLLPMTGAISEHTLTFGVTHQKECRSISLAYQQDLPSTQTIAANSKILSGEFNGGDVDLSARWLALSVSYEF